MWTQQADQRWIDAVCRQLSRVTGWPTTFAPCAEVAESPRREGTSDYAWVGDLNTGDDRIGTLNVALPPGRPLDDTFLRACESADLTAQLIQRVLIEQNRNGELRQSAVPPAASTDDAPSADAWTQTVNRVLDVALRLTGLRAAAVFVLDPQAQRLRLRAERTCDRQTVMLFSRPLDEALFDLQALRDETVVVRRQEQEFSEWLPKGMALGVCCGITTSHGMQGTLWAFDRRDRRLTTREIRVLDSLTARLGELIEQGVLIEECTLQRQLRAELRIAAESQPGRFVRVSGVGDWFRIVGRTESAREVGGDLCEVLPLGDERMLVAVGDAAGHSIPAAMVMATVRGALRVIVDSMEDDRIALEQVVARLNRVLHGIVEAHQFMTLACAIIDGQRGTLTLCNAGHPPLLLIRDGEAMPLEAHGLLLGVVHEAVYQSQSFELQPGDLLAFYTDGVSEAPDRERTLFRSQGIATAILDHAEESPETIVEHVWAALEAHQTADHFDDRSLLVLSYRGQICGNSPFGVDPIGETIRFAAHPANMEIPSTL